MTEEQVREIVRNFFWEWWQDINHHIGNTVPGASVDLPAEAWADPFRYTMEPQEWLTLARYGAGLAPDEDPGEMYEICQSMAEWLFSIPGASSYTIPSEWYDTPMGALWGMAFAKVQGDELITIAQAAELAQISMQAISARIDRGTLTSYTDPSAPRTAFQKARRLVRKSDVLPD